MPDVVSGSVHVDLAFGGFKSVIYCRSSTDSSWRGDNSMLRRCKAILFPHHHL